MTNGMPLRGYKVLDLTQARAGPVAVRLLADWGADVIRIQPPGEQAESVVKDGLEQNDSDLQNLHRNKRSLALNLKLEAGHQVFMQMAQQSDIVVENFRTEVKHRLKVDYESVVKVNPQIVYASISGFGQTGPYRTRPGVDQITQGTSGLMSVTGHPGQGPVRVGIAISDTSAGMFLGQGVLLALLHRERTGEGQWVHTSLLEAMMSKLDFQGSRYTMDGEIPEQQGNYHPTNVPMGTFNASDGYVNVSASSERMFRGFCEALEVTHLLNDPRFADEYTRLTHRQEINAEVDEVTRRYTVQELVERLNPAGVPCGPVYDIGEAFEDEQVKHLNMVWPAPHTERGKIGLVRTPINLSKVTHPGTFSRSAPVVGEHSIEVLQEFGFSEQQIVELKEQGATN